MDIKKVAETFAVLVPPLIICSCIRLYTFYNNWNISIFNYLSPSEILFSFIKPGLTFIIISFFIFLFYGIIWILSFLSDYPSYKKSDKKLTVIDHMRLTFFYVIPIAYFIGWLTLLIMVLTGDKKIYVYMFSLLTIILVDYLFQMHHYLLSERKITNKKNFPNDSATEPKENKIIFRNKGFVIYTITVLIIVGLNSYFFAKFEIKNIKKKPTYIRLVFKDNTDFETTDKKIYLGKTASYFFFYDSLSSNTIIFDKDEIKTVYNRSSGDKLFYLFE